MVAAIMGAVAVAGAAYGANKQSGAAKSAANAQANAANQANDAQLQMFNQSRQDQAPFRDAGLTGLDQYMKMLGLQSPGTAAQNMSAQDQAQAYLNENPDVAASGMDAWTHYNTYGKKEGRKWPGSSTPQSGVGNVGYEKASPANMPGSAAQSDAFAAFRNTPGYQFGLDEGAKTVQASAAARGGLNSGATLKALTKFGNDYADQQGYTPYMNRLAALSGMAQTSTNQTNALGQNYANQVGANLQNAGQARAQGIYGSANAWSNFGQQASSAIGNYFGQRSGSFGPGTIGSGI